MWILFAGLAAACFVIYHFISRNPGNVSTPEDLKKVNKNPQFHMEKQSEQMRRQTTYFRDQTEKVAAIHQMEHAGEHLEQVEEQRTILHETIVTAHKLTERRSEIAMESGISLEGLDEIQVYTAKERTRLESRRKEIRQDLAKARIEIKHNVKQAAEMAKVTIDLILKERMWPKQEVLQRQALLFEQIDSIEALMKLPPSEYREFKLQLARTVMTSWMNELNGILQQTAKGNVPNPDGKDSRGLGAAPEPRTDITEDD